MRLSKAIYVGGIQIGGGAPVVVQSMANTNTEDVAATVEQIKRLSVAGCKIVRLAVPTIKAAEAFGEIKRATNMPLVADIHFDYKLALAAIKAGADKIRINPGNIGGKDKVKAVADSCKERGIPIRIGVNSGSVERELLAKHGGPTPAALAESALGHAALLEECDFADIAISVKASSVKDMVAANRLLASATDYPLHLGVTEAGTKEKGSLRSAVGIGSLLLDGIGDTIRVSLTAPPEEEISVAYDILAACSLHEAPRVVSCPTCGRTKVDVISLAKRVEEAIASYDCGITVAVMGCAVNGPGEAREADVGIACGVGEGLLFRHGEIIKKFPEKELFSELMNEVEKIVKEKKT